MHRGGEDPGMEDDGALGRQHRALGDAGEDGERPEAAPEQALATGERGLAIVLAQALRTADGGDPHEQAECDQAEEEPEREQLGGARGDGGRAAVRQPAGAGEDRIAERGGADGGDGGPRRGVRVGRDDARADRVAARGERALERDDDRARVVRERARPAGVDANAAAVDDRDIAAVDDLDGLREVKRDVRGARHLAGLDRRGGAEERRVGQGGARRGGEHADGDEGADERAAHGAHASRPSRSRPTSPSESPDSVVRRRRYATAPYMKTKVAAAISPMPTGVLCGFAVAL